MHEFAELHTYFAVLAFPLITLKSSTVFFRFPAILGSWYLCCYLTLHHNLPGIEEVALISLLFFPLHFLNEQLHQKKFHIIFSILLINGLLYLSFVALLFFNLGNEKLLPAFC